METNVNMAVVEKNRKQLNIIGGLLGGKYFTLGAVESYPDFDRVKLENSNSGSKDFMPNRTPIRYVVRGYDVVSQQIKTNVDGSTVVIFNPGEKSEASAAIIAGGNPFNRPIEEAMKESLTNPGSNTIYADGEALAKKANELNQIEVARINAFIAQLTKMRDGLISTIKNNSDRANEYTQQILSSTPKQAVGAPGSPTIVISPANHEE